MNINALCVKGSHGQELALAETRVRAALEEELLHLADSI